MPDKTIALLFLFILALSILLLMFPLIYQLFVSSTTSLKTKNSVKVAAHRGANKLAPENTLAAVSRALELKVDMIEVDVHLTKDNKLVVIHDKSLERTTNGEGAVSDYTLSELKKLDAGSWFNKSYAGEKLPTLIEVLTLINGKATCLIELKRGEGKPYLGIEALVANAITNKGAIQWTIVQSFESSYLKEIYKTHPDIKLAKLLVGSWQFPFPFYFDYQFHWGSYSPPPYLNWVNFYYKRSTPMFINQLKNNGVKVGVFTPNSKSNLIKQINMGVDAVITNKPEAAKKILQ